MPELVLELVRELELELVSVLELMPELETVPELVLVPEPVAELVLVLELVLVGLADRDERPYRHTVAFWLPVLSQKSKSLRPMDIKCAPSGTFKTSLVTMTPGRPITAPLAFVNTHISPQPKLPVTPQAVASSHNPG